jgi:protein gp37
MSTLISWTNETLNLLTGCTKCSAGCVNCYAERQIHIKMKNPNPKISYKFRNGFKLTEHPQCLEDRVLRGKPKMIFLNSLSDTFHTAVSEEFLHQTFDMIRNHPQHIFQVLTKRPERLHLVEDYPPNVWLGVTVENADYVNRIEYLLKTNATVKFGSFEPLLGPIPPDAIVGLDWVIVGGESGPKARPMKAEWALEIKDACQAHGVPFFFKQMGGKERDKGGKLLLGKVYDEFPWNVTKK